ncbi:MAG: acyltransferase [Rhodoferax sp.]|nr:acyltransferase [Rhodoferax sp.]
MNARSENRHSDKHLPYLDGWRGIAIICVLCGHFTSIGALGGIGVSVFFVLSGLLMSRILFVERTPLHLFYRRRFARIVPVFWLYLSVVFFGGWLFLDQFSLTEFLSTALFLRSYFPDTSIDKSSVPIGHIWSLNVEEHCYILLSLLSLLAIRFGEASARIVLSICAAMCVVFFVFYKYYPPVAQTPFNMRTEVAAFPLLFSCSLFLWARKYQFKVPSAVPLISFLGAFGIAFFATSFFAKIVGTAVLLAVSVNTLAVAPPWALALLSNSLLRWFGVCSYSIYLWHEIFYFFQPHTTAWPYYGIFAVGSTLLIASGSFYFFENPLRKRLSGRPDSVRNVS